MKRVKYCIGAFLGIPEYVEHFVPDDGDTSVSDSTGGAAVQAGYPSVISDSRRSCGQSQRSARQKRKERKEARK